MTVSVHWIDESRKILMYSFKGHWTLSEALETFQAGMFMMKTVKHNVSAIFNLLESALPQKSFYTFIRKIMRLSMQHDLHRIVILHVNVPLNAFFDVLERSRLYRNRQFSLEFAKSLQAARDLAALPG